MCIWLGLAAVGGPYFGRISEVSSNDLSSFLPKSAESTKVNNELSKFEPAKTIPAIVVFESPSVLNSAQQQQISNAASAMQNSGRVKGEVSAPIISNDGKAAFLLVPLDPNSNFTPVIADLQQAAGSTHPTLHYEFTGPAMFMRDLNGAFAGIDGTLLFVALTVVFLILLIVYRSPVLPIVTLLGAVFALAAAIFPVWHLAHSGVITMNGQVQGILFILVIGATTDYSLLYIARFREELILHESKWEATKATWKASWEPIVAAGGTVTLGLLCLLVSDLGSNRTLGPVGGIGVAFAVLSALTFLPAVLLLLGKKAFWPKKPKFAATQTAGQYRTNRPFWSKVGTLVYRHPRTLWMSLVGLLVIACLFVPQLKAQGIAQSDLVLGNSEARNGQVILDKHFPGGSGSPVYVLAPSNAQQTIVSLLDKNTTVTDVSVVTNNPSKSPAPVGASADRLQQKILMGMVAKQTQQQVDLRAQIEARMHGASQAAIERAYNQAAASVPSAEQLAAAAYPFANTTPKVVGGNVLLQATLKDASNSLPARSDVKALRDSIHVAYPSAEIGGMSALQLDSNTASQRDLRVIIPLILVAITIVLMLLLRAIVAPLVLLFTTILSFGATLGISALLFNHLWKYPGADPAVVIYGFVFLVALGIDYNIFLMTRVREETKNLGVKKGTVKALVVTGGVISSAGIVLASTFAALYVIPILFLAQIAFIVAFGVLLDTLIVRSLIVPSLTLDISRHMWWPSKLSRKK